MEQLTIVIAALRELEGDAQVPKNVKNTIANTIKTLEQDAEMSIKVSRALQELEQLAEDNNMQAYTRTQIFNIVSLLEVL
jgi:uncharacterized protein (UPF0147 family)